MRVTIHQAKTNLSKLIAAVERGEEVVIARRDVAVARIVSIHAAPNPRVAGALKGQVAVGAQFYDPLPDDELALWNGE